MTCVKTTIKNRGEEFIVPGYLLVLLHGSCAAAVALEAAAAGPVSRSCGVGGVTVTCWCSFTAAVPQLEHLRQLRQVQSAASVASLSFLLVVEEEGGRQVRWYMSPHSPHTRLHILRYTSI